MGAMAERIHDKRIEAGLTMEELAEKIGVNKSSISKWESGDVGNIKRSYIAKMAKLFNVNPVWLMALDGIPEVQLTYEAPNKEPITVTVDHEPIIGQSSKIAELYQLVLAIKPENMDLAINILKSLT